MEEFTFPTVTPDQEPSTFKLPFPHFDASPLWFEKNPSKRRRSFSSGEAINLGVSLTRSDNGCYREGIGCDQDEKMDMLWEDFELGSVFCNKKVELRKGVAEVEGVEVRRRGSMIRRRRQSLLAILKLLKKIILIQKIRNLK